MSSLFLPLFCHIKLIKDSSRFEIYSFLPRSSVLHPWMDALAFLSLLAYLGMWVDLYTNVTRYFVLNSSNFHSHFVKFYILFLCFFPVVCVFLYIFGGFAFLFDVLVGYIFRTPAGLYTQSCIDFPSYT